MTKTRVFLVDDSMIIRRMLTDILKTDPALEVVGTAVHGRMALARIPDAKPDLIILDIEMPEMDGLAFLPEFRKLYPRTPVIMFSTLTERGASATFEALRNGANDYVTKPSQSRGDSEKQVKEQLIPRIKALVARFAPRGPAPAPAAPVLRKTSSQTTSGAPPVGALETVEVPRLRAIKTQHPIDIVAIGSSTGGPPALEAVLSVLPDKFPVPIVIAQHMPPIFTAFLAKRLESTTKLKVAEGKPGEALRPGHAWIAPGDYHMVVSGKLHPTIQLNQKAPENSCRPAVDVLFRSVAESYKGNALAVILTGMGQDGLKGCEKLSADGSYILAQDEESSVVWGMPGAVARAELANKILPLAQIGHEIHALVQRYGRARPH